MATSAESNKTIYIPNIKAYNEDNTNLTAQDREGNPQAINKAHPAEPHRILFSLNEHAEIPKQ